MVDEWMRRHSSSIIFFPPENYEKPIIKIELGRPIALSIYMASTSATLYPDIGKIEHELKTQFSPLQRIFLIDKLASYYTFTNVKRAKELLEEQVTILKSHDHPDFRLNYHLFSAFVENQLYNFPVAEKQFLSAIDILKDRGTIIQQAEVFIDFAGVCMNLGKMEEATDCLDKATKFLKSFPDEKLLARLICREGFMNLHYSNYSKVIELLLEADKKITTLNSPLDLKDYYFLTLIHSGLGKVYEHNDNREKSVTAYLKVVNMCEAMEMRTRLSWHYLNVGNAYLALNDPENAEPYFFKAIDTSDDASEFARASAFANLGYCYFDRKDYDSALGLFDRAEALYKDQSAEDYYNLSLIETWRGRLYAELGNKKTAKKHFTLAYEYACKSANSKQLAQVSKEIATFFAELGEYKNAYEYQLLYDKYDENFIQEVNRRKQLELEIKYEAEKKKQETELLQLQATKLQLKALRAQMNPHFMYNALNSIQNFITSNNADSAAKYLAKFAKLMRQSLDYSDLENISLEKEIEFLDNYLEINQKLRFEDRLTYDIIIDEEIEEDILGVPTMIVQPYVENAIEHGLRTKEQGHIRVIFALYDEEVIMCIVEDNGIGRKKARHLRMQDPRYQNYRSRGTSITEERLRILHNAKNQEHFVETIDLFDEKTGEPAGTQVKIKIPIVEIKIK